MYQKIVALFAISLLCLGCSSMLAPEDVTGSYHAVRFVVADDLGEIDVLDAGGVIEMTLSLDGATTGRLVIPAVVTGDPTDLVADLAGTFTINGEIINFSQAADTFIRDSDWVLEGSNRLLGGGVFSGKTIVAELFRDSR